MAYQEDGSTRPLTFQEDGSSRPLAYQEDGPPIYNAEDYTAVLRKHCRYSGAKKRLP